MRPWKTERLMRRRFLVATALVGLSGAIAAAGVCEVRAERPSRATSSFSHEGLERVGAYMRNEVATGKIPGAIVLIQQHGKPVYYAKFGVIDVRSKRPMTDDAIFRLYSMSKPITSVAAMMLVDDGKLALDDPLSKYILPFADVTVGVETHGENGKLALEPLQRPISIEDLLRHTSGMTYGFYGDSAVRKLYANSDLLDGDFDNAEFVARLAKLPLAEQPATKWDYGHSTDVLGRVIEVISGESLFEFEKSRLLGPLGMNETAFYVSDPAKRSRIAEPLPNDHLTGPVVDLRDPTVQRRWESGGAGMVGTIGDYARFAQMLLNGGSLNGKRYLRPETVALMTSDHIGPETKIARDEFYFPGADSGFGLGFAVRTLAPSNTKLPIGEYRWDGVGGTFFFVDPQDDMFAICMMQSPSQRGRIETEMKTLVYDALEN
jgi:CubicO group peptidase (beta-lactamase class C family)